MQDLQEGLVAAAATFADRQRTEATNVGIPGKGQHRESGRAVAMVAALVVLLPAASLAAVTAAQKCEGGKNDASGKYAACMAKAEKSLVLGGTIEAYDAAQMKCVAKHSGTWTKLEGGGSCPTTGDDSSVRDFLDACVLSVADALGGGALPPSGALPRTGQTNCHNTAGSLIGCAGTGHDGEFQKGVALSFTDNGDGTITDNRTGLMWEKHSDDGSIHDKDNTYTWANAFATKVGALNSTVFAGYNDWRVPNRFELESLLDLGPNPSTSSAFDTACAPACTVLTCSCTVGDGYWTSTTYRPGPTFAWGVYFSNGFVGNYLKTLSNQVRAVRGGS